MEHDECAVDAYKVDSENNDVSLRYMAYRYEPIWWLLNLCLAFIEYLDVIKDYKLFSLVGLELAEDAIIGLEY